MPNYCDFSMRVKGEKENIKTFIKWLSAEYNYNENAELDCYNLLEDGTKVPCDHHIGYRVFEVYSSPEEVDDWEEDYFTLDGYCAWSVYSCMFEGEYGTYMGDKSYGRETDKAISLVDASKELELQIEVFSQEPGCQFSEHYYMEDGDLILQDDTEYIELFLEYYDKNADTFDEEMYNELDDELKQKVEEAIADGSEDILEICDNFDSEGFYKWEYID